MSGIKKRTIFIGEGADGILRISPWRRVTTGVGGMWEPKGEIGYRDGFEDFDQADQMNRIDLVEGYDPMSGNMHVDATIGGAVNLFGIVTSY